MFRKIFFFSLLIVKCFSSESTSTLAYSSNDDVVVKKSQKKKMQKKYWRFVDKNFYVEALPGYYYPMKKRIREVYGTGGFNGQLDMGYFLHRNLACFLRGGAYWANGRSTVLKQSTSIVLGNITLGLKFILPFSSYLHVYVGGGGRVFFLRVKNKNDFVQRNISANKLGGAAVTGFWIYPSKCYPIFLDVFLDYSFYKFLFKPSIASKTNSLDISGPTVGIGLGYQF